MIALDEDALICDLAETYGIFNYRELPVSELAILASGLGISSRIRTKQMGQKIPIELQLQALSADALNMSVWMNSTAGAENKNRPESIYNLLLSAFDVKSKEEQKAESNKYMLFEKPEDFYSMWANINNGKEGE